MNPNIDRQEMRAFLLGTLDKDHKTQFEERILIEPSVYEELLIDEEELIDQYVTGELSASERDQFESHFLITAERQKNLRFGKLLQKYVNSHAQEPANTSRPGDYQVKLSGVSSGTDEFIDNYSFRVIE